MDTKSKQDVEANFRPVGTIAFIALLLGLTAMVWFSVYNLQIEKF